jgi:hypothetical protein
MAYSGAMTNASGTNDKPSAGDPLPPKCSVIEVHVGELRQLFNAIDPSRFGTRTWTPKLRRVLQSTRPGISTASTRIAQGGPDQSCSASCFRLLERTARSLRSIPGLSGDGGARGAREMFLLEVFCAFFCPGCRNCQYQQSVAMGRLVQIGETTRINPNQNKWNRQLLSIDPISCSRVFFRIV